MKQALKFISKKVIDFGVSLVKKSVVGPMFVSVPEVKTIDQDGLNEPETVNEPVPMTDQSFDNETIKQHRKITRKPLLSEEQIKTWIREYHEQTGKWPTLMSNSLPGMNTSWPAIGTCLRKGARGLRGGRSLSKLVLEVSGLKSIRGRNFTEIEVVNAALEFKARTGFLPDRSTRKSFLGRHDVSWKTMVIQLSHERFGPKLTTLPALIKKHKPELFVLSSPLEEQFIELANEFFQKRGVYPSSDYHETVMGMGITWESVASLVSENYPTGWYGFLEDHCIDRSLLNKRNDSLLEMADAHKLKYGRYPNSHAKSDEVNWKRIDMELRRIGASLPALLLQSGRKPATRKFKYG